MQRLNMMHSDNVVDVPIRGLNIGSTAFCANQGFYIPGKLWTIQAHPEFSAMVMRQIIKMMQAHGELSEQQAKDAMNRNIGSTDSNVVLSSLAEFIVGEL